MPEGFQLFRYERLKPDKDYKKYLLSVYGKPDFWGTLYSWQARKDKLEEMKKELENLVKRQGDLRSRLRERQDPEIERQAEVCVSNIIILQKLIKRLENFNKKHNF